MGLRARLAGLAALALSCAATPLSAGDADNPLAVFQQREGRLFDTGWQLARANRAFCARREPSIGLLIHDASNYARSDEVRRALSLEGDIGVQAVASGSPAASAGAQVNRTIFALDGTPLEERFTPTQPSVERTLRIEQAMATSLADGVIDLQFSRPVGEVSLRGVETCAATFRLEPGKRAYAGDETVFFGDSFMAFGLSKDAFAAAVAHELAHVVLAHPARKLAEDWGMHETRESERVADRMMPWLLFNAGYDPQGAAQFMRAWGPKHSGGLLRKRTHDGWDERLQMIEEEIAILDAQIRRNRWKPGEADWASRFAAD